MLLLDVKSSNIPLTVSFIGEENSTVLIDQKLNVSNGADIKYFTSKSHYEKWKKHTSL